MVNSGGHMASLNGVQSDKILNQLKPHNYIACFITVIAPYAEGTIH